MKGAALAKRARKVSGARTSALPTTVLIKGPQAEEQLRSLMTAVATFKI